ncbi:hypothetical protein [Baekduia sp.]|uniref:hypothetical protein n=1 Tax=Baekduia sp. TaxID=2600305 RepID=UPI002D79FFE9|nr:hypothetical protein [Baekduia sp.]
MVVFGVCATAAYGTSDFWFSGSLATNAGFASTDAHSITYIQGSADHNGFCVAKDQGLAGFDVATRATVGTQACASSGGFASRSEDGSCCYHGWIANKNTFAISVNSTTRYDY